MARAPKTDEPAVETVPADVAALVENGFTQADAEALAPEDRADLVATLPLDEPEPEPEPEPEVVEESEAAEAPEVAEPVVMPQAADDTTGDAPVETLVDEELEDERPDDDLSMFAEPEPAPFNEGVQHQLELKWQEFAAFAKTVEHRVPGDLGDIVRWVKAHA